jgi:methylmalonyl-CoA mutase N-terminal domain/subunit
MRLIADIDDLGGAVAAIEAGFQGQQIEEAAYRHARAVDEGAATVVGVNRFVDDDEADPAILAIDPELEASQATRLREVRSHRDEAAVEQALAVLEAAARSDANVLYPMKDALRAMATLGEVSAMLQHVFGRYRS